MLPFESAEETRDNTQVEESVDNDEQTADSSCTGTPTYERLGSGTADPNETDAALPSTQPDYLVNAKIFPSKLRYLNQTHTILILSMMAVVFLVFTLIAAFIGNQTVTRRRLSTFFVLLAFFSVGGLLLLLFYKYKKDKGNYEEQLADKAWLEGFFVFDSGEVVVRSNRPLYRHDMEFARGSITYALGNDKKKLLHITYEENFQRKKYELNTSWLCDSASDIAAYINSNCDQPNHLLL